MEPRDLDPNLPKIGEIVREKYRLVRVLGQGGVGVVFEAEHVRMRQRVAIKFLLPWMTSIPGTVQRFEREARAMGQLRSPYVARVLDVDASERGVPYMVMEYLEGRDLNVEIRARQALPVAEAVGYLRDACLGMREAHAAGIVHRDLKPSNVYLVGEGAERRIKILDFGVSKIVGEETDVTMTETTLGTPSYMSPEQVRSAKHCDERSDIWSLGVILYKALTGKLPFVGKGATGMAVSIVTEPPIPIRSFRPDLPEALVEIINKLLAKNPDERYQTADELRAVLEPFVHAAGGVVLSPSAFDTTDTGSLPVRMVRPFSPGFEGSDNATAISHAVGSPLSLDGIPKRRGRAAGLLAFGALGLTAFGVALHSLLQDDATGAVIHGTAPPAQLSSGLAALPFSSASATPSPSGDPTGADDAPLPIATAASEAASSEHAKKVVPPPLPTHRVVAAPSPLPPPVVQPPKPLIPTRL